MIIRAVSDSESELDDDDAGGERGSLALPPSMNQRRGGGGDGGGGVQIAWLGTTLAIIGLLLVDIAAMADVTMTKAAVDPFSPLMTLWRASAGSDGIGARMVTATMANNLVGLGLTGTWMVHREAALRGRPRPGLASWLVASLPWASVLGVVVLGHIATGLYVLLALYESHGHRTKFWIGHQRPSKTIPRV